MVSQRQAALDLQRVCAIHPAIAGQKGRTLASTLTGYRPEATSLSTITSSTPTAKISTSWCASPAWPATSWALLCMPILTMALRSGASPLESSRTQYALYQILKSSSALALQIIAYRWQSFSRLASSAPGQRFFLLVQGHGGKHISKSSTTSS